MTRHEFAGLLPVLRARRIRELFEQGVPAAIPQAPQRDENAQRRSELRGFEMPEVARDDLRPLREILCVILACARERRRLRVEVSICSYVRRNSGGLRSYPSPSRGGHEDGDDGGLDFLHGVAD